MSPGAKIFLTLAGVGAVIGVIAVAAAPAHAAPGAAKPPKQPKPSNAPPDVVVPEPGAPQASPPASSPSSPPFVPPVPLPPIQGVPVGPPLPQPPQAAPPLPGAPATAQPPAGTTITLPNPLGGAPLGTFNPATGNVFGPGGVIIGTFDPTTGIFTATTGQRVQVPGFGSTPIQNVPAPATPPPAAPSPAANNAPGTSAASPPPAAPPASAPVTTVQADTAAMVAELLAAEASPGWNKTDPTVSVWQRNRPPLVVDGKFGPKSALTVAQSIGTIPIIRFWALNGVPKAKQLEAYQEALIALANASPDPVRAQQLRFSANRERAQAFSAKSALPAIALADQIQLQKVS